MSKFNTGAAVKNKTTNIAGGKAFKREGKEELAFAVVSSFLEDKYYESGDDRTKRIVSLIQGISDVEYLLRLAYVTRNVFNMRSTTHLLLAETAKKFKGDSRVRKAIAQCTVRPDDLTELIAYLGKPVPNSIKKGIAEALKNFNQYQLTKYKMEGKEVSLYDLFNLVHPKPRDAEQGVMWGKLLKGELTPPSTWEVRLSSGENKADVWKDLIGQDKIGYMALLRNLRNIDKQASEPIKMAACTIIQDRERVVKSRQLPFRFHNAYLNIENQDMLEAISQALDHSLANVPKYDGKTLIAVDSSGSMHGKPLQIASLFAAAMFKSNDADLLLYDTSIHLLKVLRSAPCLEISEKMQHVRMGGGTQTSLVFKYMIDAKKKYDRIVILSDNESWTESSWSRSDFGSPQEAYNKMRTALGIDPYVYAIDIEGYGTSDVKGGKVQHLCGWSDKIFDLMKHIERGNMVKWIMEQKGLEL